MPIKKQKSVLFSSFQLGPLTLRNRIALAPLTRGRATEHHIPTDIMETYYTQRADAGLLISEATGISRQGLGWYRAPGIWNNEQIIAWKKIVNKVHSNNGIIAMQLWHMGRQAHSDVTGQQIVSASNIGLKGIVTTNRGITKPHQKPKALNHEEIKQIVQDYGNAAKNAMSAGFDAIQIHGANGYLIDQFLQSCSNKRTDKYGGSVENRLLFMKQIINTIISKGVPKNRIGIRLSPNGSYAGMGSYDNIELFSKAIEWLANKNIGFIEVMNGVDENFMTRHGFFEDNPFTLRMARDIMNRCNSETALMGNIGYTKETAEKVIECGDSDMISFGRMYMSNPDLVYRFENDIELEPRARYQTWFGWDSKEKGYIDWPIVRPMLSKL
eukprot:321011_1